MTYKAKLMVVDNEIDICNFVKSFFEIRGFQVVTAVNGDEAMAKLNSEKPDLVILDVNMRYDGEGLEFLPKIKESRPQTKVIMVTGVDDADSVKRAKDLGADDYITKPLVLQYLESNVMQKISELTKAA